MNREPNDTLSAFLDGESIAAADLAATLAAPGGRETLIDFVLLRGAVAETGDRPSDAFYQKMRGVLEPPERQRSWLPTVAAAGVVLFGALGFWLLRTTDTVGIDETPATPPAATRTLHFERGVDWQGQG